MAWLGDVSFAFSMVHMLVLEHVYAGRRSSWIGVVVRTG